MSKDQFAASREVHKPQADPDKLIKTGIWGPSLADWRDIVEDIIYIARRRFDNKLAMVQLQLSLHLCVSEAQNNIKIYKDILKHPENMAKYTDEVAVIENPNLNDVERKKGREELMLAAFLDIGDSHMWRMFDYDRSLLYIMGKHMSAGPMQYGPSLISELHGWGHSVVNTDVSHFIINSITNFGRIGDVLLRHGDGTIEVKEIKSKNSARGKKWKERLERQEQVRGNFLSFANSGNGSIDGRNVSIIDGSIALKSSLDILDKGLIEASKTGVVNRKISPYMNVVIFDFQVISDKEHRAQAKRAIDQAKQDWTQPSENILIIDSTDRQVFSPNRTPLSSLPFTESCIADLLLRKKVIVYCINIDVFVNKFKERGWELSPSGKEPTEQEAGQDEPGWILKKGPQRLGFPAIALSLLFYDTVSISCVIDQLNEFVKGGIIEGGYFIRFVGEDSVWK